MYRETILHRLIFITATLFLISSAVYGYSIDTLEEPYSPDFVGNLSESVRMVNVTDNGEPVTQQEVEDGFTFNYTYNASDGETKNMQYLTEGYWYAEINPSTAEGKKIDYLLKETGGTQDEFTATETLSFGNYSVELISDADDVLPPGETVNVRVNVTDEWNDEAETGAEVDLYFTNGSVTHEIQGLNNQDESEYYNSQINVPDVHDARYLIHINVSNPDDSVENSNASYSMAVQTEPEMDGNIEELEATGECDNNSFFTECEREAEISTSYNVTGDIPDQVNLTLNVWNESNSSWQNRTVTEMEEQNNLYQADLTLPDLNTTVFGDEVQLVYNATGNETNAVKKRNITVRSYSISFGAASSAQQGGEYDLEVAFQKYFSSQPLGQDRVEANITVKNSTDDLKEFTLDDMSFENNLFQKDIQIGADWPEGTYTVNVSAQNIYEEYKSSEDSFFVEEVNQTFNMSGDIEDTIITGKNYSYNFTVENLGSSELVLEPTVEGEIEGFTWVNNGSDVTVSGNSEINVTSTFNMSDVEERDGEIVLSDDTYNDSIDVDLDIPDCDYRNETYCVEVESSELNESADETGYETSSFTFYYLADENSSEEINPEVDGNISDLVSFDPETVEMNSTNNDEFFDINYTVSSSGYYTGDMTIGSLIIPISLDSSAETEDIGFDVTSSLDLGTVTQSETVTRDVEIENTGAVTIDSVAFDSGQMDVTADSAEIETGATESFELEISSISSAGSILVTAESQDQSVEESIEVSADVIADYSEDSERVTTLRERINSLQSRVSSSENQNILNTASLNVTEVENAYQAENYDKAQRVYQATEQQVSRVESQLNTRSQDPQTNPGSPGTETSTQEDGGSMLVIIAVVVLVLLIIGFIAYTSLIPEEGDPLYKVLGE